MNKTHSGNLQFSEIITASTPVLAEYMGCGRYTAVKIGEAAGAKIRLGKRVLWNVRKVQQYLDSISTN